MFRKFFLSVLAVSSVYTLLPLSNPLLLASAGAASAETLVRDSGSAVTAPSDLTKRIEAAATYVQSMQNNGYISREYLLGPNDVFSIVFPFSPEMKQENIRVLPDGTVHLALLEPMNVSGLTVTELRKRLLDAYSDYMVEPAITVNLERPKPFIVNVSGAILNPGVFELNTQTEQGPLFGAATAAEVPLSRRTPLLSNVLTAAGGIRYDADLRHVVIKNHLTNNTMEVDLMALLEGSLDNDVYLMPGDSVHVPKLDPLAMVPPEHYHQFANATFAQKRVPVKVYGYVNNPGLLELDPAQTLNLNSAITRAGGYIASSAYAPRQVIISRRNNDGKLLSMAVDPTKEDVDLMPNDIIYVPQKVIPRIGLFFDFMTRAVAPVGSVAGAANGWAFLFDPTRTSIQIGR